LVVFGLRTLLETWKARAVPQHPRKTFGIVIDLAQREKLFEQLERFANAHDFDIHIGSTTPAGVTYNIYMTGKDVYLIANNPFDSRGYDFAIYDKDPTNLVSEEVIDSLIKDLKTYISEVPNVRIFD
jgi:hypothetical protein